MPQKQHRLGRPPDSDSAATRERILTIAREHFAERGFEGATNKDLAAKTGITTGALYHYFPSKVALFRAVVEDADRLVFARFEAAARDGNGFIERFRAVLEAAHQINREDPSMARFVGGARVDVARNDALHEAKSRAIYHTFFDRLIDDGVRSGEIRKEKRPMVRMLVRTITAGLTDAVSDDPKSHRLAVDAIGALLEGRLFEPASSAPVEEPGAPRTSRRRTNREGR